MVLGSWLFFFWFLGVLGGDWSFLVVFLGFFFVSFGFS